MMTTAEILKSLRESYVVVWHCSYTHKDVEVLCLTKDAVQSMYHGIGRFKADGEFKVTMALTGVEIPRQSIMDLTFLKG